MRTVQEIDVHVTKVFNTAELSELDAMVQELATIGSDEAMALRAIVMGVVAYRREEVDKSMTACDEATSRYRALNDLHGMARASLNHGRVFQYIGDLHTAKTKYMEAIDLYTRCGSLDKTLRGWVNIGLLNRDLGDLEGALEILLRCVQQAIELRDDHALGNAYLGIGGIYLMRDEYGPATEYYRRSIEVYERQGEHHTVANALNSIASIHYYVGDFVAAAELWHQILDEARSRGARSGEAVTLLNLGNLHEALAEGDQALQCYERAREIGLTQQQQNFVLNAEQKIGNLYCQRGRSEEGVAMLEACIAAYWQIGLDEEIVEASTLLAGCLMNLDGHDRAHELLASIENVPQSASQQAAILRVRAELALHAQDPTTARDLLLEALSISEQLSRTPNTARIHLDLRDVCKQLNDFEGYIRHNEIWTKINDEIKGTKVGQQLATQAAERRIAIERQEHQKHLAVLHSTLPKHIADRVARGEQVQDYYDHAAVMFIDIVGFTTLSSSLHASDLAALLDTVFGICDNACNTYGLTKVKTIGDSYLAFAVPTQGADATPAVLAANAANAALDIIKHVSEVNVPASSSDRSHLRLRIGSHLGPVFAGVIGKDRLQYDIWGDSVNVASRLENTGSPGRVHLSDTMYNALVSGPWHLELRGQTEIKGKGLLTTYWLDAVS